MPDKAKAFTVKSNASKFATGAVLRQADINGDMHPCGYLSQSLDAAQRNYEIYNRELLGIDTQAESVRSNIKLSSPWLDICVLHQNKSHII